MVRSKFNKINKLRTPIPRECDSSGLESVTFWSQSVRGESLTWIWIK